MPLQIQCPTCRKVATVPDSAAGKSARCGCGQTIAIPIVITQATPVPADDLALQPPAPAAINPSPVTEVAPNATRAPRDHRNQTGTGRHRSTDTRRPHEQREPKQKSTAKTGGIAKTIAGTLIALAALGLLFALVKDPGRRPQTNTPSQPQPDARPSHSQTEQRAAALDNVIHQFERTDASIYLNRDDIRAIIFVVFSTIEEKRRAEAIDDLLTVAKLDSYSYSTLKDHTGSGAGLNFHDLPLAVMTNFRSMYEHYHEMSEDCKKRGTTIEAEAKKTLGE